MLEALQSALARGRPMKPVSRPARHIRSFENCWPAIMNKSHGAVLVYSPENEGHVGEIGAW